MQTHTHRAFGNGVSALMNMSHGLVYGLVGKGHNTALAQRAKPSSPKPRHLVTALWHSRVLLNQHLKDSLDCFYSWKIAQPHTDTALRSNFSFPEFCICFIQQKSQVTKSRKEQKRRNKSPFGAVCPSSSFPEDFLLSLTDLSRETLFSFIPQMQPSDPPFLANQVCQHNSFKILLNLGAENMYSCFGI